MVDNIIRPQFGKKKLDEAEAAPPEKVKPEIAWTMQPDDIPTTHEGRVALLNDLKYLVANSPRITATRDKLDHITDYIFSLANFNKSDTNIELRRSGLKSASLENLCHVVLESDQSQWQTKPNYFGAVVLEYRDRVDRLIKLFPRE